MSTVYLKFTDQSSAVAAMQAAGYELSEYQDMASGNGWGPLFSIPDTDGWFANVYDCNVLHELLQQYVVPAPLTPYNTRAGDDVQTVYRCVVVADAIRDTCRALVVALAGPTHAGMWSTELVRESDNAIFWINSGPVRAELAAMLDDPAALAAGAGIPLAEAQQLLSLADVSAEDPIAVMERMGLVAI